jgi:hypothetical protein
MRSKPLAPAAGRLYPDERQGQPVRVDQGGAGRNPAFAVRLIENLIPNASIA